jgi:hypothetical protein
VNFQSRNSPWPHDAAVSESAPANSGDSGAYESGFGFEGKIISGREFGDSIQDATFSRRVSGLSVRYSNPPALAGGCLVESDNFSTVAVIPFTFRLLFLYSIKSPGRPTTRLQRFLL